VRGEWSTAPVPERERAMLAYAVTITEDATRVSPATLDGLRAHGFDDTAILQMTIIASWFNYINRMADALGVGRG
jgi:alkylhydroperoxidase family enzyme